MVMHKVGGLVVILLLLGGLVAGALWLWQSIPLARPEKEAPAVNTYAARVPARQAELPWVRDERDPMPARVAQASCAWDERRPETAQRVMVPAAGVAWVRDITDGQARARVPLAVVPWQEKRR